MRVPAQRRFAVVAVPAVWTGAGVGSEAAATVVAPINAFTGSNSSLGPGVIVHLVRKRQERC